MSQPCVRQLGWALLPLGIAEAGVRLLAPRPRVPPAVPARPEDHFSAAEIERGARFARPQLALGLLGEGVRLTLLAGLARSASRRAPTRVRPRRSARRRGYLGAGALAGVRLLGAMTVSTLPLAVAARRRSLAAGLSTQSWSGWAGDLAKSTAISAALSGAAGAALVGIGRRWPERWWVVAAGGSVLAGGLIGALAPVVLDPLFNDFTPLPEGQVRSSVLELAQAAGVRVGEVYEVDASRRTTASNAYVAGLGPTKRVVLFDTLLERYSLEEVRVVVAHELSHVRHRDVLRAAGFSALLAPAAARAVERFSRTLGPGGPGPESIPALALAGALVSRPVGLIAARLSRAVERRADAESLELTRSPQAFISVQRALALHNLADLDPPRWVRALLASHPATLERIGAAEAYSGG